MNDPIALPATDEPALDRAEIAAQLQATPMLSTDRPVTVGAVLHVVSVGDGTVSALDVSEAIGRARREHEERAARLECQAGELADYATTMARLRAGIEAAMAEIRDLRADLARLGAQS